MNDEKIKFDLIHVGINRFADEDNLETAKYLAELFDFPLRVTPGSYFLNEQIEICNKTIGTHGHLAFGVEDVEKAASYLESKGIEFDRENAKLGDDGRIKLMYAKKEIAGFSFHLSRKA